MKTKDEIWNECYPECSTLRDTWRKAMQSFSDQENARLTAINEKQSKYLAYLKRAIHSESIIDNITAGVRDKFESELASLTDPESDIPKHPTSYRDGTMTEKSEEQEDNCKCCGTKMRPSEPVKYICHNPKCDEYFKSK